MGWSVGFDSNWQRDIGYGVPAYCDHPDCNAEIDRGLAYVCGGEPYGGLRGCGLFFCGDHLFYPHDLCSRCDRGEAPYEPKPDHSRWVSHKLFDASWAEWRQENRAEVERMRAPTGAA